MNESLGRSASRLGLENCSPVLNMVQLYQLDVQYQMHERSDRHASYHVHGFS